MTNEEYTKLAAIRGDLNPDQLAKLKAFENSKVEAAKVKAAAEAAAAKAAMINPVGMTKADRDRMVAKLVAGGYPVEKVDVVKAKIAEFDSKES
jgi:hypothetical protein